jgi:hypothetical protein
MALVSVHLWYPRSGWTLGGCRFGWPVGVTVCRLPRCLVTGRLGRLAVRRPLARLRGEPPRRGPCVGQLRLTRQSEPAIWYGVHSLSCRVNTAVTLPPRPELLDCSRLRTPGDCWRNVWARVAGGLPEEGRLAVPTPWPPVARRLLADLQRLPDGGGSGPGHLLDPGAQTPRPQPACRGAGGVCRGHRPVAGQPHWPEHQR